jgi:SAM-dependent methyltransferase
MTDPKAPAEPMTWHYGLVARWWFEFNRDGPEIAYFRRFIEENGEPALDVACGTGRLLVPFRRAGLDVDGCDISPDMLALCRQRAESEGLSVTLFDQPVHRLDLPRRYRTIVFCGGFALGGNRAHDMEGLLRLYEHLEPGGLLVMDNEVPYTDTRAWPAWLKDGRANLPEPLPEPRERRRGEDGADYALRARIMSLDPLAQRVQYEMHAWMWRDDQLITKETHDLALTFYFTEEISLMLERAGFVDVTLRGDYTDAEPTADTEFVVFVARKPAS